MSIPENLSILAGEWMGVNSLWLNPDAPVKVSEAEARVELVAQGKFLCIQYTWVYADVIQEGLLLIGCEAEGNQVSAAWVDSWHYGDQIMHSQGKANEDGSLMVTGTYPAPSGPYWGWWITIQPVNVNEFKILMHNVPPDSEALLAVEMVFERLE
jgi:hypothetical protein